MTERLKSEDFDVWMPGAVVLPEGEVGLFAIRSSGHEFALMDIKLQHVNYKLALIMEIVAEND